MMKNGDSGLPQEKKPMNNPSRYIALTILSLASFSVPITIYVLWIKAANLGDSQAERVEIFRTNFPEYLHGRWDTTLVSIFFCYLALFLSGYSLMISKGVWKVLNALTLLFCGLLLALNLFSMM